MARYSYSKLQTYGNCPLQYKYRYIDRVPVEVGPSIEAFLGSRVHDALEWLYSQAKDQLIPPSVEELLARYHALWDAAWTEDIRIVRQRTEPEAYRRVGEKCLELYYDRHTPFDEGIVLGLEEPFSIPLEDGILLVGYLDRLEKRDGDIYEVHDYKTSGRLPTPAEAARDEQAGWYALAVRERFPHAGEIRLVWHYLRFDERLVTARSAEESEALKADIVRRIRAIEAARSFPPQESALCAWCDYFQICPAKGHRRAVEEIPGNAYLGEPGVVLVNRLATLKEELKAFTEARSREIAQVEEALIHYAREQGFSVVVGTDTEVVIEEAESLALPGAKDPARPELEEAIRRAGLWEGLSDLSLAKLRRALQEGGLPADLRARLAPFAEPERKTAVRLRKRQFTADEAA